MFVPPNPAAYRPDAYSYVSQQNVDTGKPASVDGAFKAMSGGGSYDMPLPQPLAQHEALQVVLDQAAIMSRIETAAEGSIRICLNTSELRDSLDSGVLAVLMHIEGAEAIDDEFNNLDVLYNAGLRSVGPVWSRSTRFGHGVPFRFPATPDTGDGLTDLGKELVRQLNKRRMMIDLSHLNEKGFWDVHAISDAPLVATHSNAWALSESARNLTDSQLAAIRESGGMVGLNFATAFLRKDGRMISDTGLDEMLAHLDYLIEHLGEESVGFGSDFDGAVVPNPIRDVTGLTNFREAMRAHGYDEELLARLCFKNWLSVLERSIG